MYLFYHTYFDSNIFLCESDSKSWISSLIWIFNDSVYPAIQLHRSQPGGLIPNFDPMSLYRVGFCQVAIFPIVSQRRSQWWKSSYFGIFKITRHHFWVPCTALHDKTFTCYNSWFCHIITEILCTVFECAAYGDIWVMSRLWYFLYDEAAG